MFHFYLLLFTDMLCENIFLHFFRGVFSIHIYDMHMSSHLCVSCCTVARTCESEFNNFFFLATVGVQYNSAYLWIIFVKFSEYYTSNYGSFIMLSRIWVSFIKCQLLKVFYIAMVTVFAFLVTNMFYTNSTLYCKLNFFLKQVIIINLRYA